MAGSAPHITTWVLLEYRCAWGRHVTTENELDLSVREWLTASLRSLVRRGERPRVQFIRRERDGNPEAPFTLFISRGELLQVCKFGAYTDLLDVDIAAHSLEPLDLNHYFVCTNDQRDQCCGRLGKPLFTAMRARLGDRVWETSHVGGHRMAPNVLVLPAGYLCGRVFEAECDEFLEVMERDGFPGRWLRGRTAYPAEAQACEAIFGGRTAALRDLRDLSAEFTDCNGNRVRIAVPPKKSVQVIENCGAEPTRVGAFVTSGG